MYHTNLIERQNMQYDPTKSKTTLYSEMYSPTSEYIPEEYFNNGANINCEKNK